MTPLIVSFFTPAYADHAAHMEASAKEFGLETDVRGIPDLGAWELNCGLKPQFILQMMGEHRGRPIVWLDADARVRHKPELFETLDCDFAAHWRCGAELLSGTMFFGRSQWATALVDAWISEQSRNPKEWDQRNLQAAIDRVDGLVIEILPSTYTRIFDDPKMGEPVIEHLQASRQLAMMAG